MNAPRDNEICSFFSSRILDKAITDLYENNKEQIDADVEGA